MTHNQVIEVRRINDDNRGCWKSCEMQGQDIALVARAVKVPWYERLYRRLFPARYQAKVEAEWTQLTEGHRKEAWMGCPECDLTRGGTLPGPNDTK
jgi:hypothetical protein